MINRLLFIKYGQNKSLEWKQKTLHQKGCQRGHRTIWQKKLIQSMRAQELKGTYLYIHNSETQCHFFEGFYELGLNVRRGKTTYE